MAWNIFELGRLWLAVRTLFFVGGVYSIHNIGVNSFNLQHSSVEKSGLTKNDFRRGSEVSPVNVLCW